MNLQNGGLAVCLYLSVHQHNESSKISFMWLFGNKIQEMLNYSKYWIVSLNLQVSNNCANIGLDVTEAVVDNTPGASAKIEAVDSNDLHCVVTVSFTFTHQQGKKHQFHLRMSLISNLSRHYYNSLCDEMIEWEKRIKPHTMDFLRKSIWATAWVVNGISHLVLETSF